MKNYNIYMNPQGDYRAVKEGWSWTAFFFTGIWALVNKMWVLGVVATAMEIFTVISTAGFGIVLNIFWSIILGIQGNKFLRNQLVERGYDNIQTVEATTSEGAIAAYLKEHKNGS